MAVSPPVDTLLVRIQADMSDLRRDLKRVETETRKATDKVNESLKRMQSGFSGVGNVLRRLGPLIATGFAGVAVRSFVRTGAEIEGLKIRMNSLFGSVEEGTKAFNTLTKFAAKVPFSLQEIQQGAGSLSAVANNASQLNELLTITGNIAANFKIPFAEAASNVQRAMSAGAASADTFRDRGVLAFSGFQAGVSYTADETAKKLQATFGTGGTASGSMDQLATTFDGTMSMLNDSIFKFQSAVAEAGLLDAFKELADMLRKNMDGAQRLGQIVGSVLAAAVRTVSAAIELAIKHTDTLLVGIAALTALAAIKGVLALGAGFVALATSIASAKTALALFNAVSKKGLLGPLAIGLAFLAHKSGVLDQAIKTVEEEFNKLFPTIKSGNEEVDQLIGQFTELAGNLKGGSANAADYKKVLDAQNESLAESTLLLSGYTKEQIAALKATGNLKNVKIRGKIDYEAKGGPKGLAKVQVADLNMSSAEYAALLDKLEAVARADKAVEEHNRKVQNAQEIVKGLVTEEQNLKRSIDDVRYAMENGKITMEEGNAAIADLQMKLAETDPFFKSFKDRMEELGSSISETLADAVISGKLSLKSLLSSFMSFVRDMIAEAIKMFLVKKLLGGIFGAFTGGGDANFIGGTAGGGAARGFAGGGRAPMLVGERGPELFVPHSAGSIKNNMDTKNILGGAGNGVVVNQTINVETGVAQTVRAEIMSLMPSIRQDTLRAVVDARRRGGTFAQAFGG